MKTVTKAELDRMRASGASIKTLKAAEKTEAPTPPPDTSKEVVSALENLSETQRALAMSVVSALAKMAPPKATPAPVSFKFDIERDSRGLMKSIRATPEQS
jgi:hypothetical protein